MLFIYENVLAAGSIKNKNKALAKKAQEEHKPVKINTFDDNEE
jgi:hypothetical protein